MIEELSRDNFKVLENLGHKGARTLCVDPENGNVLPTADFELNTIEGQYKMIPGTFRVLVYAKNNHTI